jgi:CBS domain-containing protein
MKSISVKQLMIPLAEYATVSEDATLYEAVVALEEAQKRFDSERDRHRAILVLGKDNQVVGKLSQWDILKGLEPKYDQIGQRKDTSRYGFSPEFLRSMMDSYGLWRKPLEDLCRKGAETKVGTLMHTLEEGEYVAEDAPLDEAIHLLVMGHHQSLLVRSGDKIVGILRLSDVFREICRMIKTCRI